MNKIKMKNDKQKKNQQKAQVFIALSLVCLFLTLPMVSALSLGGIVKSIGSAIGKAVSTVVNAVKNVVSKVVTTVKNVFTGGSGGGSGGGSSGGSNDIGNSDGGSSNNGDTYYPQGDGVLISAPEIVYSAPVSVQVSSGDALWHDIDLTSAEFKCMSCPANNPQISGFNYELIINFVNRGNTMAKDVELLIDMKFPDGEIRSYDFTGNKKLNIAPGSYRATFLIPDVGLSNNKIKSYAIREGVETTYNVETTITLKNDRAVDRAKIIYEYTPKRECRWTGTIFNPIYSCTNLEPDKSTSYYCSDSATLIKKDSSSNPTEPTASELKKCTIADTSIENEIKTIFKINTISPELWGGGSLSNSNPTG